MAAVSNSVRYALRVCSVIMGSLVLFACGGGGDGGDDGTAGSSSPTLAVASVAAPEGNSGSANLTFVVTLSGSATGDVSFDFATAPGSGDASDYVATSGSSTIAFGATSATIDVLINGDEMVEPDETFTLTLSDPVNATISAGTATGTITNDDFPLFSIADAQRAEGDSGDATLPLTVTLDRASPETITVDYVSSDATATSGTDYAPATGTLRFPAGTLAASVDVTIFGDTEFELDEQFVINLLNASANARIADDEAVGVMTNDDLPTLNLLPASVIEADSGTRALAFALELNAAAATDVVVTYATQDRTAIDGLDYVGATGSTTIAEGQTSAAISIDTVGDDVAENPEAFALMLNSVQGAVVLERDTALGSILDNDSPPGPPLLRFSNASVAEGDSGRSTLELIVQLDQVLDDAVTFDFTSADGTADSSDFAAISGQGAIAAGDASLIIPIEIIGDTVVEGDESFTLTFSNVMGDASFAETVATLTIVDDDMTVIVVPEIFISNANVIEGDTGTVPMVFNVTLSDGDAMPISVDYNTEESGALADQDFVSTSGTLTFAPGVTALTVTVDIIGDTFSEDDESFRLRLSNLVGNATLDRASAIGTIETDEALARLSIADVSQSEGDTGTSELVFTVNLDVASTEPTSFDFATRDESATVGKDYDSASGALQLAPGDQSITIAVTINGDTLNEDDESFAIELGNISSNVVATRAEALGVIVNDDGTPGWQSPINFGRGNGSDVDMNALGNGAAVFKSSPNPAVLDDAVAVAMFTAGTWQAPVHVAELGVLTQDPRIAMADNTKAVAVWPQNGIQSGISTNGIDWDTQLVSAEAGFFARVDGNNSGDVAFVLESRSDNFDPADILSNLYRGQADLWDGIELLENNDTGSARTPFVAMDDDGNRLVFWNQLSNDPDLEGKYYNYFDGTTMAWTGPTRIPEFIFTRNFHLRALGDGRVALTFQQNAFISTPDVAELWVYDPAADTWSLLGAAQTDASVSGFLPEFAVDGAGNIIVAWLQLSPDAQYDVYANRYDATTNMFGQPRLLETGAGSATPFDGGLDIAADAAGNVIVVWSQLLPNTTGENYRIRASRYTVADDTWSPAEQIDDESVESGAVGPDIGMDAAGNAIVVWEYSGENEVGATHFVAP